VSWVDDAVRDFGRGMGLERLALPEADALALAFERRGTLNLQRGDGCLLAFLSRDYPFAALSLLRGALEACHYREQRGWPVQAGLHGDTLVLLARIPEAEVSLPVIERVLDQLTELHDRLSG
jgi:type III secretion system chaperone SycN